jgi:hypothetical protein
VSAPILSRRDWLKLSAAGALGVSACGWFERLAAAVAPMPQRKRSCILLWMAGGPSQMETFDCKPGHKNGGAIKEINTSVPGIKVSENLPQLAKKMKDLAILRSMETKEGDHTRATYHLRTGYLPLGSLQYPAMGSFLSKELGNSEAALPNYVSIAPATFLSPAAYGPGYLGPEYAPLMIGGNNFAFLNNGNDYTNALKVQDLLPPKEVDVKQFDSRLALARDLQEDFSKRRQIAATISHRAAYERAVRLMKTSASKAFELNEEKAALRDKYGRNLFGQGCLLARRLVERGVPFVEVGLYNAPNAPGGWDTHNDNNNQVKSLCSVLDPAFSTLLDDLRDRGLLDGTMVVWAGEFGRTPTINPQRGRDHFPNAWSTVLAGGGVKGGQVYGETGKDGMAVTKNKINVPDFMATVVKGLGLNPEKQNMSNVGRPIRLADAGAKPIKEVLA